MEAQTCASGAATPEAINMSRSADSGECGVAIITPKRPTNPVTAEMITGAKRIAEKINSEHGLAQLEAERAIDHALECGRLLIEQKERVGHGNFGAWFAAAGLHFSRATAGNYMRLARNPSALGKSKALRHMYSSGRPEREPTVPRVPRAEGQAAPPAREIRVIEGGSSLMSGAPSASRQIAVTRAIETLRANSAHRALLSALRRRQSVVAKSERRLTRAQQELAQMEREVINAARRAQEIADRTVAESASAARQLGAAP